MSNKTRNRVDSKPAPAAAKTTPPPAPAAATVNPLAPPGATPSEHDKLPASLGSGDAAPQKRERKSAEPLVSVTVHTPFKLTLDHGHQVHYAQGVQDVPKSHADHWYAKHHLEKNED